MEALLTTIMIILVSCSTIYITNFHMFFTIECLIKNETHYNCDAGSERMEFLYNVWNLCLLIALGIIICAPYYAPTIEE